MNEREVFEKIITIWRDRRDDTFTFLQLGGHVFGKCSPENAARIGGVINGFKAYFRQIDSHRWKADWGKVGQDWSQLINDEIKDEHANGGLSPSQIADAVQAALNDEKTAVRRQHPIKISSLKPLLVSSLYYEAVISSDDEPDDFVLPEGIPVKLQWKRNRLIEATETGTLLAFDSTRNRLILKFDRPVNPSLCSRQCEAIPTVVELIDGLIKGVQHAAEKGDSLCWKLFKGDFPKRIEWQENVLIDRLDEAQSAAVKDALTHDITYIWGPPGTGKTHTLARLIVNLLISGETLTSLTSLGSQGSMKINPTLTLVLSLRERKLFYSLPFKGRVGVGMGYFRSKGSLPEPLQMSPLMSWLVGL